MRIVLRRYVSHFSAAAPSELRAADDLGAPVPKSLFSQSFALRRISPLEFRHIKRGVPVYHNQPLPQKRGGSIGYGGVFPGGPIDFGGQSEEEGTDYNEGEEREHGGLHYDQFDYDDGQGRQQNNQHGGPASYEG